MALLETDFELIPRTNGGETVMLRSRTFLAHGLRVRLLERSGVFADDAVLRAALGSAEPMRWPIVVVSLEGGGCGVISDGRTIEMASGEALIGPAYGALRAFHDGRPLRWLLVQWDPRTYGAAPPSVVEVGRLAISDLELARALAHAIESSAPEHFVVACIAAFMCALRGFGLAVPADVEAVVSRGPQIDRPLVTSLNTAFASKNGLPSISMVQEELRRSRTEVYRRLNAFLVRSGFAVTSWSELRSLVTIDAAAMLMTAHGARSDVVSKMVGYSSPTAMCRAFARVGLPSPRKMRATVLRSVRA